MAAAEASSTGPHPHGRQPGISNCPTPSQSPGRRIRLLKPRSHATFQLPGVGGQEVCPHSVASVAKARLCLATSETSQCWVLPLWGWHAQGQAQQMSFVRPHSDVERIRGKINIELQQRMGSFMSAVMIMIIFISIFVTIAHET